MIWDRIDSVRKRKVFWAPERKPWTMQGKRNTWKERRKKKCVIWGVIDSVGKRKVFWAPERKQCTMQGRRNTWKERRKKKDCVIWGWD